MDKADHMQRITSPNPSIHSHTQQRRSQKPGMKVMLPPLRKGVLFTSGQLSPSAQTIDFTTNEQLIGSSRGQYVKPIFSRQERHKSGG
jgi:hypothetical protein